MKKQFLLLILLSFGGIINAQLLNFTISPSQGLCNSPIGNTVVATVLYSPANTATFTWSIGNMICVGTASPSQSNSLTAILSFPSFCCGLYYITCSAYDINNNFLSSTTHSYIIYCSPNLNVVTSNSTSTSSIICAGSSITLSVSGATSYTWNGAGVSGSTLTTVSISPSVTSCYSVTGSNTVGCSSSAVNCFTVQPLPTLTVTGNFNICKGEKYTYTASGASNYLWSSGSTATSITLNPTATAVYSLSGTLNSCSISKNFTINVNPCTGIKTQEKNTAFSIYPNPFTDVISVESKAPSTLMIFDVSGKLIQENKLKVGYNEINTTELKAGIYLVQAKDEDGLWRGRFVKVE